MCVWMVALIEVVFWSLFIMIFFTVFYANGYCKRNGINMNTFPGLFEMYRHVFMFKNKMLSCVVLVAVYGGALAGVGLASLVFYARSHGCVVNITAGLG